MGENLSTSPGVTRRRFLTSAAALSGCLALPISVRAAARSGRVMGVEKMDIDRFVADCVAANKESDPQAAVLEVVARAVSSHSAVLKALGEPTEAGIHVLHQAPDLTIFNATWTPQMNLMPHNHRMWANIGIYTGREDNILWSRGGGSIEASGAKALFAGDAAALPATAIHSVTNPLPRYTGGIHIYGGDFFATRRSQWDPETRAEEPSDGDVIRAIFQRENERIQGRQVCP